MTLLKANIKGSTKTKIRGERPAIIDVKGLM